MNGRIDYSNLQNITKQLKQNISKKYETFEKLTSEISGSGGSSGGSGGGGGGLGELGDLLNIFFSQGTYNGTLKINGGLVVDYIETDDAGEAGDIDKASINKLIDKAIRSNNKRIAGAGGPGGAGSIGSLSGVGISSASIRNSFFSGGTIDGATVENLDGLNNLFKDDYLDMYSIASVRDNFIFYVSSAYNDIRFTYDDKERDYYTLSFGQQKDIFTQQDWVLGNQNIANTYINSKVYNVLFQPENLPIGITGLTQTVEEQRAKFKISDMNVEIGKSTTTTANPIMTVNGDLKVMSGGRIFLDTREIKPTGGSGAIFSIPEDGITNTGVIKKITIDNGGSGYDPGSANIIFGAPRFATREVFTSEGSQSAPSATVTIVDGAITAVNITGDNSTVYPGPPIVTISSSSGGTGAIVTAEMSANRWQSPAQATITGFAIASGGSGYSDGTTTVSISSSPEVTTAILEQGSLVVVNGVITSVQLPENGIGSFYMRGTNTIIMNTTDTASSQTLTDLFGESISLTNDSLTDLQIKYVAETLNQTTLSSIATNNKNIYESLTIKSGMNIAHNVAIIQNIKFKIKTAENLITHIGPYNTLTINEFVVPEGKGATIKNWFDGFKVFQKTSLGNIELSLLKVTLTDITHDTDSPEQPTLGSAADGDAIGTFNGLIELDIVVTEKMTNAQKLNGYPSSLYSGSNINGNETSGYPIYIGEANTNSSANLKLPVDSSDIPRPIEFFGTYQLYNSATGSLEFITDGVTDFISGNKTFFSGDNNKIIIGYNSVNSPTLNNNELLHVNGIIKSTSIENTAIGSNTPSTGNFSALTVTGSSVINGDLTVNGTQTTINSSTLTVDDKNIEMGTVDSPTELTAAGGGIILKGATDKSILWNSENWTSSENFNLQSGKIFKINNTSVLSADTLGSGILTSSLTTVATLDSGSISSNFGDIDNGDSNITCGGVFHIDKDADANDTTADSTTGRISLGVNSDLNIYHGGTDSFIVNKIGNLELHTQEASKGFVLDAKNGTIEIKEDGTLMTRIDNSGINIVSGDEYQIDGYSVLSDNTLGSGVVTSSLTTVATLDSGSISSNFGDINNGDSNITSGGVLHIDKDADANDTTADSTIGRISLGVNSGLNLYHGGTDSFIVNKTGNLELHTQEASTGFILNAKNGTIEIKEDGTLMTTINNTGINIVSGDEYQINNTSVLSDNTLGSGVVTSSLTTVATLDSGSISSNFGDIDNGDSNIISGGVLHIDKDADVNDTTADSTTGRISLGVNSDLNLYHGGTDSFIVNKIGNLELHTQEASKGFILDAKNGTIDIKEDGTLMTTINNTGINIVSGDEYQIDGSSVLSDNTLGSGVVTSSLTTVATLDSGSISSNFGDIDNGDSNITSGGVLHIDKDADANDTTADSTIGRISLGVNSDLNLYHGGTDSFIVNKIGNLELHTQEAFAGVVLDAKNGTIEIKADGTLMTIIDNSGINIVSGGEYHISGYSVLSNNSLGSGVVMSSLTTVATLDSGSISSNFGDINNGYSNITSGGVLHIDSDADANDTTADSTIGRISLGANSGLNLYHGGTDSFIVNKTGNLELHTQEASTGFIIDAKNGTIEIKEDGTLMTTINNTGINIVSGDEYKIDGNSVLSDNTLGSGVVTSSLTTVATLDSGSISSNFGDIDIGANTIKSQDILVTNVGIGVTSATAALDIQDIFANKSSVNTIVKITSTTDDNTANIGFGGRISLNAENGGDASNSGSIQEAVTIDYYLKERDVLDTDNTTTDLTADIWGLNFRIKDDEQMVDALTIVGAGGGPDGDNTRPHGSKTGIGIKTPETALHIQDIFSDKSNVNTILTISSKTDDDTANIGFGGRISLKAENGGDAANGGSIQEAATIDYYLKERDVLDTDNTTTDLTADIWGLKFRIKDDEQMVDALTIIGAGGGPDGDNSQPHGANIGIGTNTPTNKLDVNGTFRSTGAVTLDTTLDVTGATTLSSTLSITGATTIDSTLSISGKYYGDGSELTSLSTNLISNDNSSVDILTKTVGNSISFDGVSTNSVYDERTSSGNIVSYSFRFKMTNATQTAYLFSSPTGTGGTTSNNRYVKIYNSGSSISLSNSNETTDGGGNVNGDGTQYFQNDTLHHVVISAQTPFSGPSTTDYKIYVDGVYKFTQSEDASLSSPYTSFQTKFKLGIGHDGNNGHLDGEIQELYIFNSTITNSEATDLYNNILPFSLNNSLVHSLATTSSEFIKFKNESTEIMRITDNKLGIGTISPGHTLDVVGTLRTSGATIINSTLSISGATVIDSTLSLSGKYYGDGSELKDLSTNLIKNDNSSIDVLTQSIGNSISFDGVSTNTIYNERTASGNVVSYSFKFRSSDVTQNMYLFSSPTGTGGTTSNNRYVRIYNSGSSISLSNSNETTDGSGNINGDGSQYFQNDTWHHIVVSAQTPFSGPNTNDYKIYVDGVFKFTQSEDASLSSPYTSFQTKFKLGIGHFGTNEHFDGEMQEIYIFNSTISASQVSELYDSILPFNLNSNIVEELGASNSECIKFKNESSEIMRITDNKLGIGTASPTEKLHVNGNIIANTVEANFTGNVTGDVTGDLTGDVTGDLTGDVTGDLKGDVIGDLTGDVTGNLTGDVTGDLTGDVIGNVTGDLTGDVTGNITGSLKGDVEEGEWKGKAIASTKLAVSEAIKTLSVIELNAEPGDEINENSDQALGTDATTTTADKAWREQTHNKLKKAEQNVESLRNTVESLVLAMSQIIKAFE